MMPLNRINRFLTVVLIVLVIVIGGLLLLPSSPMSPPVVDASPFLPLTTPTAASSPPATAALPSPSQYGSEAPTGLPEPTLTIPSVPAPESPAKNPTDDLPDVQMIAPSGEHTTSSITVQEEHRPDGMYLTLTDPVHSTAYRLGPLAQGAYQVGPNDHFLVYVTDDGRVFALRLGDDYFVRVVNLKRTFTASLRNVEPSYRLAFYDARFVMFLIITEDNYGQDVPVPLPRWITY